MSVTDSKMEDPQSQLSAEIATTNAAVPSAAAGGDTVKEDVKMNGNMDDVKDEAKPAAATSTAPVMNGDAKPVDSNGSIATGTTETPPIKTEATTGADDDGEEDDAESIKSEGADEEDALFTNLEQEEEKEEAAHPHEQPKDTTAAPKLLQSALKAGDVQMDDSEHGAPMKDPEAKPEDSGEEAKEEEPHVHQRVSHLAFSLCICSVIVIHPHAQF